MSDLPQRLRWILSERNLSARALSRAAGLSDNHVSMILRGVIKSGLSSDTVLKLSRAARVSSGWLMSGDGEPEDEFALEAIDAVNSDTDGVDERPREKEAPSTFGGFPGYARIEATAKTLAPEVPQWAWDATARTHPLWVGRDAPSATVIAEVAQLIMRHGKP